MRDRDENFYQKKIELTPEQKRAFKAFIKAVEKCEKENIYWYLNMDTLAALNGDNVKTVGEGGSLNDPRCLQYKSYPTVQLACSWADDVHYIVLHDEELKKGSA